LVLLKRQFSIFLKKELIQQECKAATEKIGKRKDIRTKQAVFYLRTYIKGGLY
jgi:hypothetical protein